MRPGAGRRTIAKQLYTVIAACAGVLILYRAIPDLAGALQRFAWDLEVDLRIARAFVEGYNPYSPEGRVRAHLLAPFGASGIGHPPSTVFWFLPLATMESASAHAVVGWLSVFLVLIELVGLAWILGAPAPLSTAWLAFAYVMSMKFMVYHLHVGQLSAAIGFLYFAAWSAARRREDVLAGLALGAACTLKLFPGLMVFLFLLWRRWRVVLSAVALYLVIGAIMTTRFGAGSWLVFFANERNIAGDWIGSIQNQAMFGVILRLFRPVCVFPGPLVPAALLIATVLSLSLIGGAAWCASRVRSPEGEDAAFAVFAVLSLVTPQWTWEHYDVIYILPAGVAAALLVRAWQGGARRGWVVAGAAALTAAVASWYAVDRELKAALSHAYWAGDARVHLRLHLVDTLNWLHGFVLLGVTGGLLWAESRPTRAAPEVINR